MPEVKDGLFQNLTVEHRTGAASHGFLNGVITGGRIWAARTSYGELRRYYAARMAQRAIPTPKWGIQRSADSILPAGILLEPRNSGI